MTWNDILTYENFELAWRRIRNSSISTTKDRLGLKVFSQALNVHISKLIQAINDGSYTPESPSILYLPKKSGRLRPFTLLSMRDRLVYQAIGNVLIQNTFENLKVKADITVFSPVLAGIDKDYIFLPSLRRGDDIEGQFLKFTRKQADLIHSQQFKCVVQADIASFYPSIDHNLLVNKLVDNSWLDDKSCNLLKECLKIWSSDTPKLQILKGLPIGYETSDLLANLFLKEIDEMLEEYQYLRYVDDIRIYAETSEDGERILNQLDIFLQKQGLILQGGKSEVVNLANLTIEDNLQQLEQQQLLLSDIDRDVNSPNENLQETADQKMRDLLIDILGIKDWEGLDIEELLKPTEETSLFFSLYRIREKNILLRDICLQLLTSHPHRSYAIVRYLTLFYDDELVIEKLWEMVLDESKHGQVRANCLRALYSLTKDYIDIRTVARDWLSRDDLSLAFCAIEIIQQFHDEKEFLETTPLTNLEPHLLYAVLSTLFVLIESVEEKIQLISQCLNNNNYMIASLGSYFLSTAVKLIPLISENNHPLADELIEDLKHKVSIENVEPNIRNLFNITDRDEIELGFLNTPELNQLLINIILSKETNRDEYLRNLAEFLTQFSHIYQALTNKKFTALIAADDKQNDAFDYSKMGLMNLSDFKSSITFVGTRPALGYVDTEKLHEGISIVLSNALKEIVSLVETTPDKLPDQSLVSSPVDIPIIFFSYSHDDDKKREKLRKNLQFLEIQGLAQLWSDRKIPPGDIWSSDIEEKLNSSIIVLFLITSNFTGSDFINKYEMPCAVENFNAKKTVCVPILLEDCVWKFWPYKHLQALPKDAIAITLRKHPDSAYREIGERIQELLEKLENKTFKWRSLPAKK